MAFILSFLYSWFQHFHCVTLFTVKHRSGGHTSGDRQMTMIRITIKWVYDYLKYGGVPQQKVLTVDTAKTYSLVNN